MLILFNTGLSVNHAVQSSWLREQLTSFYSPFSLKLPVGNLHIFLSGACGMCLILFHLFMCPSVSRSLWRTSCSRLWNGFCQVNTVSVMNPFFQRPNFSDTRSWNRSGCWDSPLLRFVCESDGSQLESQQLIGATLGAPLRGNKAMWTYLLSHLRLRPWSIY